MIYTRFYDHIITRTPDQVVEWSGGPFYHWLSKLFPFSAEYPIEVGGFKVSAPWGLASGWADSYKKLIAIKHIGAGIVFTKTVTLTALKGNKFPRLVRDSKRNWLINSMGLPNPGLGQWLYWMDKYRSLPEGCFFSVKGNTIEEWVTLIRFLAPYSPLIELNFSCPNIAHGIIDIKETVSVIRKIREKISQPDVSLALKISSEYSSKQIISLLSECFEGEPLIDAVTLFNTYPIIHQKLGNPQKRGGLSGKVLYNRLNKTLTDVRKQFSSDKLPIFATGGITTGEEAKQIWNTYKAFPLTMTAFLTEGPFIFRNWARSFTTTG